MTGHFSYVFIQTSQDTIDIEDIGNCYIETCNDVGEFFYLAIRTCLGISRVTEYGPYSDGIRLENVACSFYQFEYNEKKLSRIIYNFLNNQGRNITQARELEEHEYKNLVRELDNPVFLLWEKGEFDS